MKAIVYRKYGSPEVLELQDIDRPQVGANDLLVRVRAASPHAGDWHMMRGEPWAIRLLSGIRAPKNIGMGCDFAGEVEFVGKNVERFRAGAAVFGQVDRLGSGPLLAFGSFAEYVRVSEHSVELMPDNIGFPEAAAVPTSGVTALQALRTAGKLQPGQKVLINGASGGVGTFAVQIAKALGAHVTGVCSSPNVELILSLGADAVIDYTLQNFTSGADRYDLIIDIIANHSLGDCRRVMQPKGICVVVAGEIGHLIKTALVSPFISQSLVPLASNPNQEDLMFLRDLLEAGKIRSVIDRQFSLAETAEAIRYLETKRVRGKLVILP